MRPTYCTQGSPMKSTTNVRGFLAATSAIALIGWGATAAPAVANGNGQGSSQGHGAGAAHGQPAAGQPGPAAGQPAPGAGQPAPAAEGRGNAQAGKQAGKQARNAGKGTTKGTTKGSAGKPAGAPGKATHAPAGQPRSGAAAQGDRAGGRAGDSQGRSGGESPVKQVRPGNNGTVKIAPYGSVDEIPDNTPHPGCSFVVEWYGFDEGADIVSTVSFGMQAPTSDVALSVDGPTTVFVGGDPGQGAGAHNDGLDGRQAYTLSFDGAAHPQQGYHVKLTVSTPYSLGADQKTKVFWVEACEPAPVAAESGEESGEESAELSGATGAAGAGTSDEGTAGVSAGLPTGSEDVTDGTTLDEDTAGVFTEVTGVHSEDETTAGVAEDTAGADAGAQGAARVMNTVVPTVVNAGLEAAATAARSAWALVVAGLGVLLGLLALVVRRRQDAVIGG